MNTYTSMVSLDETTPKWLDLLTCEEMIIDWLEVDMPRKSMLMNTLLENIDIYLVNQVSEKPMKTTLAEIRGQLLWEIFQQSKNKIESEDLWKFDKYLLDERIEDILLYIAEEKGTAIEVKIPLEQLDENYWGEHGAHFPNLR